MTLPSALIASLKTLPVQVRQVHVITCLSGALDFGAVCHFTSVVSQYPATHQLVFSMRMGFAVSRIRGNFNLLHYDFFCYYQKLFKPIVFCILFL